MAGNFARDEFVPKNMAKYKGKLPIIYRSSWEYAMMTTFDEHPNVQYWMSETISIPYRNPLTGKQSMYIPDFVVCYLDKKNHSFIEMIEVKPAKEVPGFSGKSSRRDKLSQTINAAKWQAAMVFCARRNWRFRVATENEMFAFKRKKQ